MNLNALANRPAVSALPHRVCFNPYRELMNLFEHDRKYGARLAGCQEKFIASFKLATTESSWASSQALGVEEASLGYIRHSSRNYSRWISPELCRAHKHCERRSWASIRQGWRYCAPRAREVGTEGMVS